MDPLDSLDDLLADPGHRDLTRILRRALFTMSWGTVAIVGERPAVAAAVERLAREHPVANGHYFLLQTNPTRVSTLPDGEARPVDATTAQVIRSFLRQDPDGFAVDVVEADDSEIMFSAVTTGHQLLGGFVGAGADDVLRTLGAKLVPGLRSHLIGSTPWVAVLEGRHLKTIQRAIDGVYVDVAVAEPGRVVVHADKLPWHEEPPPAKREPVRAPPLRDRPPGRRSPRSTFVPVVGPGDSPHRLHASSVLWPRDRAWPACRSCALPLAHVVQLDLSIVPDVQVRTAGMAQLFVCAHGCDTMNEAAPGVVAEIVDASECVELETPEPARAEVLDPGSIVDWVRVEEDPSRDDLVALGLVGDDEHDIPDEELPLRCDKVGGWPAWEQGREWPENGSWQLLFQLAEGAPLEGGEAPRWDEKRGAPTDAVRAHRVLDPNLPRRFELLSGEGVAFLFVEKSQRKLAFRWQTG